MCYNFNTLRVINEIGSARQFKKEANVANDRTDAPGGGATPTINWDDSSMKTSYANVVNVSSSREEVTLLFGTNQTWHTGSQEFSIKLSDRMIISPFAAKRLLVLLQNIVGQYETRFGQLDIGVAPSGPTAAAPQSEPAQPDEPEEAKETKKPDKGKVN